MDLQQIAAKNRSFFHHDFIIYILFKLRIARFTNLIFKRFIFKDKTSPPGSYVRVPLQGSTLGSNLRVLPQNPNLWFHPRIPPILGSWMPGLTLVSLVPLFRYAFCYEQKVLHCREQLLHRLKHILSQLMIISLRKLFRK